MKERLSKNIWIIPLIIAVLIGSASVVGAIEYSSPAKTQQRTEGGAVSATSNNDEERLYEEIFHTVYSRSRWLYDLMLCSGKAQPRSAEPQIVFKQAQVCGILSAYTEEEIEEPLNRRFIAATMVKALDYQNRSIGDLADITSIDSDLSTLAYYGYFLPDEDLMLYPDAEITVEEYDSLIAQLKQYRLLKGKRMLSFGDSIMYGTGNDGEGIADMIAEKYGMTATDYSVPGAAFGVRKGKGHIYDQLQRAYADWVRPDIILIDGGTNDMNAVKFGKITDGFDMKGISDKDFSGGMEKVMWSLTNYWGGVPIIYIRVHDMNLGEDSNERQYGERALEIAEKWNATSVDLFTDTDMCTEDPDICNRYTYPNPKHGNAHDSIHPNALGYAKFYLPLISEAVVNQFQSEELT